MIIYLLTSCPLQLQKQRERDEQKRMEEAQAQQMRALEQRAQEIERQKRELERQYAEENKRLMDAHRDKYANHHRVSFVHKTFSLDFAHCFLFCCIAEKPKFANSHVRMFHPKITSHNSILPLAEACTWLCVCGSCHCHNYFVFNSSFFLLYMYKIINYYHLYL